MEKNHRWINGILQPHERCVWFSCLGEGIGALQIGAAKASVRGRKVLRTQQKLNDSCCCAYSSLILSCMLRSVLGVQLAKGWWFLLHPGRRLGGPERVRGREGGWGICSVCFAECVQIPVQLLRFLTEAEQYKAGLKSALWTYCRLICSGNGFWESLPIKWKGSYDHWEMRIACCACLM